MIILLTISYILIPFLFVNIYQLYHYKINLAEQLEIYNKKLKQVKEQYSNDDFYFNCYKPNKKEFIDKAYEKASFFDYDWGELTYVPILFWPLSLCCLIIYYVTLLFIYKPVNWLHNLAKTNIENKVEHKVYKKANIEQEILKLREVSKLLKEGEEYESEKVQAILKTIDDEIY